MRLRMGLALWAILALGGCCFAEAAQDLGTCLGNAIGQALGEALAGSLDSAFDGVPSAAAGGDGVPIIAFAPTDAGVMELDLWLPPTSGPLPRQVDAGPCLSDQVFLNTRAGDGGVSFAVQGQLTVRDGGSAAGQFFDAVLSGATFTIPDAGTFPLPTVEFADTLK